MITEKKQKKVSTKSEMQKERELLNLQLQEKIQSILNRIHETEKFENALFKWFLLYMNGWEKCLTENLRLTLMEKLKNGGYKK